MLKVKKYFFDKKNELTECFCSWVNDKILKIFNRFFKIILEKKKKLKMTWKKFHATLSLTLKFAVDAKVLLKQRQEREVEWNRRKALIETVELLQLAFFSVFL